MTTKCVLNAFAQKGDILNISQVPGAMFKHCKVLKVEKYGALTVRRASLIEVLFARFWGWVNKAIRTEIK